MGGPWEPVERLWPGIVAVGTLILGRKGADVHVGTECGLPSGRAFLEQRQGWGPGRVDVWQV